MKKLVLSILVLAISLTGYAQIETPQPSPSSKLEQKVGLTDVTLEYSRPSMRGRTIFGDLVPYGKLWRTGANANTKITFSDDVTIGEKILKAGSYAIYTMPNAESWDVIFYADTNNWGTPQKWDESKVATKINVPVFVLPMNIETFSMSIDNISSGTATLGIFWENAYVGVPFNVPTDAKVVSTITKVMNGPSANDYYAAAVYYSQEGKDITQAQKWMDKAMSMTEKPAFWQLRQQSLIYAKAGNKKAAIETAKKSLAGAEAAGNNDYVKMNNDSLKEWGAM
ncbi:DUF2911 domain-containing protein [Yeosuana sp.]|uniref:DUF2911 domain-containing protein n=1 Tax=Yeosuana sp. TaxID=2529388 RepID=UPI004054B56E